MSRALLEEVQLICQRQGESFIGYVGKVDKMPTDDGGAMFRVAGTYAHSHVEPDELAPMINMLIKGYSRSKGVDPIAVMQLVAMHLTDNARADYERRQSGALDDREVGT